ncbi:MAG TPA: PfkB family carbohydrate kinase [Kineosporiaceae bacterium]|nr:PfkB family carbohydrate kinase [Kineosporiaceae bacterium]
MTGTRRGGRPGSRGSAAQLVCVALSPSIDVTYIVPRLRPGTIHRPREVYRVPGGKGFNVARAAQTLGADVVATGVLGGDSGAWMVAMLGRAGIRIAPVAGVQPTRTCLSIADQAAGTLTEMYEPAPLITPRSWSTLLATVVRLCDEHPSWVSLSGSLPPGPVPEALADLVAAARSAGARVAVDTHSTTLAAAVGAGADLVKVNVQEAAALLGSGHGTGYDDEDDPAEGHPEDIPADRARHRPADLPAHDPVALAHGLLGVSPGTGLAVVTAGAEGAVAVSRDGWALRARLDALGDYPVGSGDSFLGGLLAALAAHPDDQQGALRLAMGAGAANALTPGAGVLDAATARELAARVVLEAVQVDGGDVRSTSGSR